MPFQYLEKKITTHGLKIWIPEVYTQCHFDPTIVRAESLRFWPCSIGDEIFPPRSLRDKIKSSQNEATASCCKWQKQIRIVFLCWGVLLPIVLGSSTSFFRSTRLVQLASGVRTASWILKVLACSSNLLRKTAPNRLVFKIRIREAQGSPRHK